MRSGKSHQPPKSRSIRRSLACFNTVSPSGGGGGGNAKTGSKRRTRIARIHVTMEACTADSLLFAQNFDRCPKVF